MSHDEIISMARDALLVVNEIGYAQSRAESDAEANHAP